MAIRVSFALNGAIMSWSSAWRAIFLRDIRLYQRASGNWIQPLIFFLVVATLFPLGASVPLSQLQAFAPVIIWVAGLLATLLATPNLYEADRESGVLEQLMLSATPLWVLCQAKIMVHWCVTGLPLTILGVLVGGMLGLPSKSCLILGLSLLLGSPALSMIASIGAALMVASRHKNALLAIIILPLYIPILILGTLWVNIGSQGEPVDAIVALLASLTVFTLSLGPIASATALKMSVN